MPIKATAAGAGAGDGSGTVGGGGAGDGAGSGSGGGAGGAVCAGGWSELGVHSFPEEHSYRSHLQQGLGKFRLRLECVEPQGN